MIKSFIKSFIIITIIAVCGVAAAFDIPPQPDGYVTDRANMFSPRTKSTLEQGLYSYDKRTSNQIFIATFPSMEGGSLEDIAIRLAEVWKPGQGDKDNGIIILIFKDDRKVRIEVGYGLEGIIPDALAGQIIRNYINPEFAENNYDKGILTAVSAIVSIIERNGGSGGTVEGGRRTVRAPQIHITKRQAVTTAFIILLLMIGLTITDIFAYKTYRYNHRIHKKCYSFLEYWIRFSYLLAFLRIVLEIMWWVLIFSVLRGGGGRRGSGGFSGGGGGGFGGGGASGGW